MKAKTIVILILSIICIYVNIQTYYYLQLIEKCKCLDNNKYGIDIHYIKYFDILQLLIFLIYIVWSFVKNQVTKIQTASMFITIMLLLLLIGLYSYTSFHIFKFYKDIQKDCKCVEERLSNYFKYFNGISYFMNILQIIYSFSFVFIIILLDISK